VGRTGSSATPKKAPLLVRTLSGLPSPVSLSTTSDFSRCFCACTRGAGGGGDGRCRDLLSAAAGVKAQLGDAAMAHEYGVLVLCVPSDAEARELWTLRALRTDTQRVHYQQGTHKQEDA
jgi:hypothetical protein